MDVAEYVADRLLLEEQVQRLLADQRKQVERHRRLQQMVTTTAPR